MALLFMDSFDHYATADLLEKWTQVLTGQSTYDSPVIGAYGRNSTQGCRMQTASNTNTHTSGALSVTVAPSGSTFICGLAFKTDSFTGYTYSTDFTDNANSCNPYVVKAHNINDALFALRLNSDATLGFYRVAGSTGTLLGTTSVALQADVWAYIELKVVIHDSAGTVDVRINGASCLSLTGQNTRGTGSVNQWSRATFAWIGGQNYTLTHRMEIEDVVVMDGSGSFNNDFIGDVTISAIYPNGAGNSSGWTPSAGSNYQNVDEALVNDDTDYNSTSTVGAKDLYAFPSAPAGADIRAVQIVSAQRKGAEGPGKIKHVVRSNSVDYDQTEQGIGGTSYAFLRSVLETDPGSGSPLTAWSESGFNAAEFGIKKTG